eukprot:4735257-Prymnesium_polylepis.1
MLRYRKASQPRVRGRAIEVSIDDGRAGACVEPEGLEKPGAEKSSSSAPAPHICVGTHSIQGDER